MPLADVSFIDDSAFLMCAANASAVLDKLLAVSATAQRVFAADSLGLNFTIGKPEAVVALRAKGARAQKARIH